MLRFPKTCETSLHILRDDPPSVSILLHGHARLAMERVWRLIANESTAFRRDAGRFARKENFEQHIFEKEGLAFLDRSTARTISIINLTWVLDGIVVNAYEHLVEVGNHYFPEKYPVQKSIRKIFQKRLPLVNLYRNHFAAHSSFALGDSISQQLSSLVALSGGGLVHADPRDFVIGGLEYVPAGETATTTFHTPFRLSEQLPKLDAYFSEWDDRIGEALAFFGQQCPLSASDVRVTCLTRR